MRVGMVAFAFVLLSVFNLSCLRSNTRKNPPLGQHGGQTPHSGGAHAGGGGGADHGAGGGRHMNIDPNDSSASSDSSAVNTGHNPEETEALRLMNAYRQRRGLRSLKPSDALRQGAKVNSEIQLRRKRSGHYAPNAGPEIAFYGPYNAANAINGWADSRGHNAIMLGGYSEVGLSKVGANSWTARFR